MDEITRLEQQVYELHNRLRELRAAAPAVPVPDYRFDTLDGEVSLRGLFRDRDILFVIHNMGQACRYCTLWADGLNGFLPHLEDKYAVALVSKDPPEVQRRFANARGWRFRMASHGGGAYIQEQAAAAGSNNMPGVVVYVREGDTVLRKNATAFGPGDDFCSLWSLLSLAGIGEDTWIPQYGYWRRPGVMDDGGEGVRD
jgi:predicted dithiol-disulfide oxidoreductase (DUF899 family)